jgi:hypothetical protein
LELVSIFFFLIYNTFNRGTSILFRKGLDIKIVNVHKSNDGRIIFANIIFGEKALANINMYAKNKQAEWNLL